MKRGNAKKSGATTKKSTPSDAPAQASVLARLAWGWGPLIIAGCAFGAALAVWLLRPTMSWAIVGVAVPERYAAFYPATLPVPPDVDDILIAPGTERLALETQIIRTRGNPADLSEWEKRYIVFEEFKKGLSWEQRVQEAMARERENEKNNKVTIHSRAPDRAQLLPFVSYLGFPGKPGHERRRPKPPGPPPEVKVDDPEPTRWDHPSLAVYVGHLDLTKDTVWQIHVDVRFSNNKLAKTFRCHVASDDIVRRRAYEVQASKALPWQLIVLGVLAGLAFTGSAASEYVACAKWPRWHRRLTHANKPGLSILESLAPLAVSALFSAILVYAIGYLVWVSQEHQPLVQGLLEGRQVPEFRFLKESLPDKELRRAMEEVGASPDAFNIRDAEAPLQQLVFQDKIYAAEPYRAYFKQCTDVRKVTVFAEVDEQVLGFLTTTPNVEDCSLFHCKKVAGASIGHLKQWRNLRKLTISNSKVSDEFVKELPALTKLERLLLENCEITDAAMERLADLPAVEIRKRRK